MIYILLIVLLIFACVFLYAELPHGTPSQRRRQWYSISLCIIIVAYTVSWLSFTEGGARALRTAYSNFSGGLEREVNVYDSSGEVIDSFSGKFDLTFSPERILLDMYQEDGSRKRVQIWNGSNTVIIKEK